MRLLLSTLRFILPCTVHWIISLSYFSSYAFLPESLGPATSLKLKSREAIALVEQLDLNRSPCSLLLVELYSTEHGSRFACMERGAMVY